MDRPLWAVLAFTSIAFFRTALYLINDPEGPNLLIVLVGAGVIFALSLMAYGFRLASATKFAAAMAIQLMLVTIFYYLS